MLLKKMIDKFRIWKSSIPISVKVTGWYSFFIIILISTISISSFIATNIFIDDLGKRELLESVDRIAKNPNKFEDYDDGIFFIKYSGHKKIDGIIPKGFDKNIPFSRKPLISTYKNPLSNEIFYYYDVPLIKPNSRYFHKFSDEWIRGILPTKQFHNYIKFIFLSIAIIAPIFLIFIVYVGYKIIKNGFKPVKQISKLALDIQENKDFSKRIELGKGNDEIHKMALTFNKMLDTLENSYLHEKQFSSDVSHELKTPVTVILAESDYAINYTETLEEAQESFEIIKRQTQKISNLITQIMELTKLEQQYKIELSTINISELIKISLNDYKFIIDEKKIKLIYNIDENLEILANKTMIERVFDNLFSNAIKFTTSKIEINLYKKNNVILEIIDDGLGLTCDEIKQIWNRFYQANNSRNKENNAGFGLGLSIVKKIIQLHGAKILVESEVNRGTKFIIIF